MDHADLYQMRDTYNKLHILLCFNGPFSQGLIEEIGSALKRYMQSEAATSSSALDVFAVYIELAQNIRQYSSAHGYCEADASATVVIGRDDEGRYVISAGNVVEPADGEILAERVCALSTMDKAQLKAAYKEQLRQPRSEQPGSGAGLGLIDIARKASSPVSCSVQPVAGGPKSFFSLRVAI